MDKTSLAMAGAVGALVSMTTAQAAAPAAAPMPAAQSFAELLEPIPNAIERLQLAIAADAAQAGESDEAGPLIVDGVLRGAPPASVTADGDPQLIEVVTHRHGIELHRHHHQPPPHRHQRLLHRRHHLQRHEHT